MDRKTIVAFVLGVAITTIVFASYSFLQQGAPTQQIVSAPKPAPTLEKFEVSGYWAGWEGAFLIMDAGKELGIWAKYGLDPQFVTFPGARRILATDIKEQVTSGIKIGINTPGDVLLARSMGAPVKMVAWFIGEAPGKLFIRADGPVKAINDLNGKKVGVPAIGHPQYRNLLYLSNKFGIKPEIVAVGNLTNQVVSLKLGRIDAFMSAEGAALRLVDSGELRILAGVKEILPDPWVSFGVFATDDLISRNPDLVRSFVKATLETVKYLQNNPRYASELYIKGTSAPEDLADKAVSQLDWQPSGYGTGMDLVSAITNVWQYSKDVGAIPVSGNVNVDDAVDIRFLP